MARRQPREIFPRTLVHAAREEQAHLEAKITRLRAREASAVVVSENSTEQGIIGFGSTVTFEDTKSGKQTFRLVASRDANPTNGTLSTESPVARALSGHRQGDVIKVVTPSGKRELKILDVS